MISIFNCRVSSTPVGTIRFGWTGPFMLKADDQIVLKDSNVTVARGQSVPLGDWSVVERREVDAVGGGKYSYEIALQGPADSGLTSGSFATVHIAFKKGGGGSETAEAFAGVDYEVIRSAAPVAARAADGGSTGGPAAAPAGAPAGHGGGGGGGGVSKELKYLTGFPFQVYDGVAGAPTTGPAGGGSAASAKAMVDAQMRAILGRTAGTGGVAGMLAALDRSFQLVDDDGNEVWVAGKQSYPLQSDIGAGVTGEQASIARLAAAVGDEILPLVAGLTPLIPEASVNPDEIAAAQAIISSSWTAFVTELGSDAGPRITRATSLLTDSATQLVTLGILLGMYKQGTFLGDAANPPVNVPNPPFDALDSTTWPIPNRANGVVTNEDEVNYTNFLIASDRMRLVISLYVPAYVAGTTGPSIPVAEDRGYLVTLLQRAIDASGESAIAVYAALDSVNLGQDEREVTYVAGTGPDPAHSALGLLSVEDILSWAANFPADEAEPLLQDAGNVGIASIASRATQLKGAVDALISFAPNGPSGLGHPRVIYALDILSGAIDDVVTNAGNPALGYTSPVAP